MCLELDLLCLVCRATLCLPSCEGPITVCYSLTCMLTKTLGLWILIQRSRPQDPRSMDPDSENRAVTRYMAWMHTGKSPHMRLASGELTVSRLFKLRVGALNLNGRLMSRLNMDTNCPFCDALGRMNFIL